MMKFEPYRPSLRGPLGVLAWAAAGLIFVTGCGVFGGGGTSDDNSTRNGSGVITGAGEVGVNALQLGDCFNDTPAEEVADITTVDAVPCVDPHDNEVYYLGALPEADYPGEDLVEELVSDQCLTVFDAFAGVAYAESQLEIGYIFPSEGTWSQGDRGYICVVYDVSLNKIEGSMRGRGY